MTYIIITPVKNEAKWIREVIESIVNQTQLPGLWVLVDGGSTDKTREIITGYAEKYPWIAITRQKDFYYESHGQTHMNVAIAVNEAYAFAVDYCGQHQIFFKYIWTIDADQILQTNVCAGIIHELDMNPTIGAASGKVLNSDGTPDMYPEGELPNKRVYRKEAFDQIGGFPLSKYSYDTVILAKLRIAKWGIKSFPLYTITNLRDDSGIERNTWKSAKQFGRARYYLGYSWVLLILGCGYLVIQKKIIKATGIFCGYTGSVIRNDEVTSDKQIWEHFHNDRINDIWIEPKHIGYAVIFTFLIAVIWVLWRFK
jgi:glycosyltransferase involved in cell wall biosynthesis